MEVSVTGVYNDGNDILRVTAIDKTEEAPVVVNDATGETGPKPDWTPTELVAYGWVSATTNHYDPSAYDAAGHLRGGAKARVMTAAEIGDYARSLLAETYQEAVAVSPTPIAFQ